MSDIKSIGLIGIPGVGKSTFIRNVQSYCILEHLSASGIIQNELLETTGKLYSSEEMRKCDTDTNQTALISGFRKVKAQSSAPVVLDAHTIIDKGGLIVPIKPSVFEAFDFDLLVCLTAPAARINDQRNSDDSRVRPKLSVKELENHQGMSTRQAIRIGIAIGVPTITLSSGDELKLVKLIYPNFKTFIGKI